jgi:hypothetical protein
MPDVSEIETGAKLAGIGESLIDRHQDRRWWPILVPLALVALAISLVLPAGRHQWALSLFRQPTYYTALSFNRASALPTTAVENALVPISFTIGNHEGRTIAYRYLVTETAVGSRSRVMKQSTKVVAAGAESTVSVVVRFACALSPCTVRVSLPGHPETIDFLMTRSTR